MRASCWRKSLCPSSPYPPIVFETGSYDEQIVLDLNRTFREVKWFDDHHETLRGILNTFSVVNEGFGYPQGLNYLACPLFYVYYHDSPKTAVEDTFYSLQSLVRVVLPLYPLDAKDTSALATIVSVTNTIVLQCYETEPKLQVLFSESHFPFIVSIVSSMVPTMYANIFTLHDTLLLWDELIGKKRTGMFKAVVRVLVQSILFHKNLFIYLPADKSMTIFQNILKESISVCI